PLPEGLPMVSADRTRFVQILMNLGSNAVKYNRPLGSVRFDVSAPDADHVRICVQDTGIGIPLDKQAAIFQPFQRAGQEAGPIEGTGIGLVITKRLASLMNGDIDFESEPGRGSRFWVTLPAHAAPSVRAEAPARGSDSDARLIRDGHRLVLYVE